MHINSLVSTCWRTWCKKRQNSEQSVWFDIIENIIERQLQTAQKGGQTEGNDPMSKSILLQIENSISNFSKN